MIKIHASYGLKVPDDQPYSSQSFHAAVEVEVSDAALDEGIRPLLEGLWRELKAAVAGQVAAGERTPRNGEMLRDSAPPRNGDGSRTGTLSRTAAAPPPTSGRPEEREGKTASRGEAPATRKQINYLLSCARRFRNLDAEEANEWLRREHNTTLDSIDKARAGRIIDLLQGKSA